MLPLSWQVTLQHHQVLHLPRKVTCTKCCTCHGKNWAWNSTATSPSIAPATKSDSWTAPNTAPAPTKAESWLQLHQILGLPLKLTVELHQIQYRSTRLFFDSSYSFFYPLTLVSFDSTSLWLYYFWLYYSFTLLFFESTIILLYYSFTLWSRLYIGSFSIKFPWLNLRWVNRANHDKTNEQKTQTKINMQLKQNFSKTMAANINGYRFGFAGVTTRAWRRIPLKCFFENGLTGIM